MPASGYEVHVDQSTLTALLDQDVHLAVFDRTGGAMAAEGRLVGYCSTPAVLIEEADGTRRMWSTNLHMEQVPGFGPAPDGGEGGNLEQLEAGSRGKL